MAQNTKILKMLNGELLIAEVLDSGSALGGDKTKVRIRSPMKIVIIPTRTDPNNPSIGLAPWPEFTEDKEFTLERSHVVTIVEPIKEFVSQYSSMLSGLVLPSGGSKLFVPGT